MGQEQRKAQLKEAARKYFEALAKKDFDLIPYAEHVLLRAPLAPGGVHNPLVGKEQLRTIWWAPLPEVLGAVKVLYLYYNEALTAVIGEAEVEVLNPQARLRVADRFTVNDVGQITEQENHFDPRYVTHPGWQSQSG